MGDGERGKPGEGRRTDPAAGGFSILLGEESIRVFMAAGDFSSAMELDRFMELGARIEGRLAEEGGRSLMALSAGKDRLSRDFTVLQIAHILAKHGREVVIVDCDFISPGLSGLVDNADGYGFLDLLLYGSSLKTVAAPTGIDGVKVIGAGSFPVSRTIPFAKKEFGKIRDFLSRNNDVVIYCSTLYTDDGTVNPLNSLVDGIILTCRIEEIPEGQMRKSLGDLGPDLPPVEFVCFGEDREDAARERRTPASAAGIPGQGEVEEGEGEGEWQEDERLGPAAIEKTADLESERERRGGVNLPRLVTVVVVVFVAAFLAWWFMIHKSISDKEGESRTAELARKQLDVQEIKDRAQGEPVPVAGDSTVAITESEGSGAEQAAGEIADSAVVKETERTEPSVREAAQKPAKVTPAPKGSYYAVHVASFKDMNRAGSETSYLEKKGYSTAVKSFDLKGEIWYRVYVVEFGTREEAEEARLELLDLPRIGYARVELLKY